MDQQPHPSSPAVTLEARIARIRQNIAMEQERLARGSRLTAFIGCALCLVMAGYFYYFYVQVKQVVEPKAMVEAAELIVMDSLPQARKALEEEIKASADDWAADLSQELQKNMPTVRTHAEEFIMEQTSRELDRLQVFTAQQFRGFVRQNREKLDEGFKSLKDQEKSELLLADLETAFSQTLASDMREQSEDMLHVLFQLNKKLDLLEKGERLDDEQLLEREILMIAKRLQYESQLESAGIKPAKKDKEEGSVAAADGTEAAPANPTDTEKASNTEEPKTPTADEPKKPAGDEPKAPAADEPKKPASDETKKPASEE